MKSSTIQLLILFCLCNLNFTNGFNLLSNKIIIDNPVFSFINNDNFNFLNLFNKKDNLIVKNFIDQIENFENSDLSSKIESLNNDNIKYYTQIVNSSINIDNNDNLKDLEMFEQYKNQYILRLYDWNDSDNDGSFFDIALLSINDLNIPIWEKSKSHKFIDVQVNKSNGRNLLSLLSKNYNFKSDIIILDLPQTIFETFPESNLPDDSNNNIDNFININNDISTNTEIFFKNYRDLDSIYAWFDLLVDTYSDILTVEYIGNTFEGRPMKALRLSVHSNSKNDAIKTVVITSGIHAREWISISSSCFILFQLLSDYENGNLSVKRYLENLDFFFLPVMNPDGYEYTWKSERLWRKNRQKTFNPRCPGIDIDHSFGFHFTSGFESPCSDDYSGESEFEALESYNWDKYLNETKHSHPIYAYIDLHSYAEEVLYPYAYSCDILPRDEENLLELAYGLGQAIRLKSGKYYEILKACEDKGADLLPSMGAGSALDYMYHNKAYWAFVLKLRDSGTHGFLLPSKYIVPVGKEIYAAVKYFAAFLLSDKY